jgi:predicted Rossmann fold nucleotide-binding protein DprA/Smf involved in DNA uptake
VSNDHYIPPCDTGPLFAHLRARPADPPTSHAAAKRAEKSAGGHRDAILAALAAGPAGQTEIARRAGLTVAQVSRRLHELRERGRIEWTGREVAAGECEYRRCGQ